MAGTSMPAIPVFFVTLIKSIGPIAVDMFAPDDR
jgi:hypothetical protein